MKKVLTGVVFFCSIIFFSCKSGDNDPKSVLADFFKALAEKDVVKARSLATKESKDMLDLMEAGVKNDTTKSNKFDMDNMEFGEVIIEGDKAIVPVKEKASGAIVKYVLKKENGWKVAFDKATMMKMGMETMNDASDSGILQDSIANQVHRAVEGVNKDSLKKSINEELNKAFDSLQTQE